LECHRRFKTVNAARRASLEGCPNCGSVDVDLAPATPAERARHERLLEMLKERAALRGARP
jgi:hypothetical protein